MAFESIIRNRLKEKQILLMTHLVLGYPSLEKCYRLIETMVHAGVDIMDSIIPTKYARERTLFTFRGPINLTKKKKYRKDKYPIDPNCTCYTCRHVSRAYLYHLYQTTTTSAQIFAALHNTAFCLRILQDARQAILEERFEQYYSNFMENYMNS